MLITGCVLVGIGLWTRLSRHPFARHRYTMASGILGAGAMLLMMFVWLLILSGWAQTAAVAATLLAEFWFMSRQAKAAVRYRRSGS